MKKKTKSDERRAATRFLCLPTVRPLDTDVYLCGCPSDCHTFCPQQCLGSHCSTDSCGEKCISQDGGEAAYTDEYASLWT